MCNAGKDEKKDKRRITISTVDGLDYNSNGYAIGKPEKLCCGQIILNKIYIYGH